MSSDLDPLLKRLHLANAWRAGRDLVVPPRPAPS